jgi:DNA-directed RNA polymerase subunit RPC12/RpoP
MAKRHPATVTSDRLLVDYERCFERFSGSELVAVGTVRHALQRIAGEDGARCPNCNGRLNWSDPDMATCTRCGDEWSAEDHLQLAPEA